MLEGLAELELLKDIQIILIHMIKCVKFGVIKIYEFLNGGIPEGAVSVCRIAQGCSHDAWIKLVGNLTE